MNENRCTRRRRMCHIFQNHHGSIRVSSVNNNSAAKKKSSVIYIYVVHYQLVHTRFSSVIIRENWRSKKKIKVCRFFLEFLKLYFGQFVVFSQQTMSGLYQWSYDVIQTSDILSLGCLIFIRLSDSYFGKQMHSYVTIRFVYWLWLIDTSSISHFVIVD